MDYKVKFGKNQKLPDGYTVEWWEADEMYHWTSENGNNVSIPFRTRWKAYRSAWAESRL